MHTETRSLGKAIRNRLYIRARRVGGAFPRSAADDEGVL